jgi:hypothetical protein
MNIAMETLWPMWAIAAVFAFAFRQEIAVTVAGVSWWHRILGGIAAVAFFAAHLPRYSHLRHQQRIK